MQSKIIENQKKKKVEKIIEIIEKQKIIKKAKTKNKINKCMQKKSCCAA